VLFLYHLLCVISISFAVCYFYIICCVLFLYHLLLMFMLIINVLFLWMLSLGFLSSFFIYGLKQNLFLYSKVQLINKI